MDLAGCWGVEKGELERFRLEVKEANGSDGG